MFDATKLLLASAGLMMFALAGCEEEGTAEQAGEAVDEAAEETGEAASEAAEETGKALDEAGDQIEEGTN